MPTYYSSSSQQSYYSSTNTDGQRDTHAFSQQTQTNPDGTTIRTAYQDNDKPVEYTEDHIPGRNRHIGASGGQDSSRRIQDVSDEAADKKYKEAIEEEYAKREGGA